MAAEAFYFFLDKKVTKNQVTSLCFFAARGLYPAKRGSTTGCLDLRLGFARTWPPLHANLKGPLQPHKATMCCPIFGRSWEDDNPSLTLPEGEGIKYHLVKSLTCNVIARRQV